jgi:hypothetical protein
VITYTVFATPVGYTLVVKSGERTLGTYDEDGGHGPIEEIYGKLERVSVELRAEELGRNRCIQEQHLAESVYGAIAVDYHGPDENGAVAVLLDNGDRVLVRIGDPCELLKETWDEIKTSPIGQAPA